MPAGDGRRGATVQIGVDDEACARAGLARPGTGPVRNVGSLASMTSSPRPQCAATSGARVRTTGALVVASTARHHRERVEMSAVASAGDQSCRPS